jgi:WD40 repeat protein
LGTVALSRDGRTLAASGADNTVLLLDLTNRAAPRRLGQPLIEPPFTGHSGEVISVVFSPDGRTLATDSNGGPVLLWDLSALNSLRNDPLRAACARGGGGLDPATWNLYAPNIPSDNVCPR